jgi:hypothetical protein
VFSPKHEPGEIQVIIVGRTIRTMIETEFTIITEIHHPI